ncbi:hypothetical protein BDN72DRAFT_901381 [Pluteus cervinus]|uniref:Uncharacterized protein n=1 Tax=Pluteus cervinus TaxID=181527 RepID=A0ACD3AGC1_9AGAR|nr:hypothetical protein BDN72DRAFT_901381 [Pluteus cervinus]
MKYLSSPNLALNLSRFSDTLTTLALIAAGLDGTPSPSPSRGYSYQDIELLIRSLERQPPHSGVLLEKLYLQVATLSPEMFDLMAKYLVNLRDLELEYTTVAEHKDRKVSNDSKRLFLQRIKAREYPGWSLQSVFITYYRQTTLFQDVGLMAVLADRIPTIQKHNRVDWPDFGFAFDSD